jgi:Tfp pilus assembly protein PilV
MKQNMNQQGALLLEAMVALAIFSVAMLSLAGAQINSSKSTFSSLLKTDSAVRSSEIIDKMRMNLAGVTAGDYTLAYGDTQPSSPTIQGEVDIKTWIEELQTNVLRGTAADAAITCVGLNCTIAIRWDDVRAYADVNESQSVTYYTYTTDVNL